MVKICSSSTSSSSTIIGVNSSTSVKTVASISMVNSSSISTSSSTMINSVEGSGGGGGGGVSCLVIGISSSSIKSTSSTPRSTICLSYCLYSKAINKTTKAKIIPICTNNLFLFSRSALGVFLGSIIFCFNGCIDYLINDFLYGKTGC